MAVDWLPPTYVELALADAEQLAAAHLELAIIDHNHEDQIDLDDGDDRADDNDIVTMIMLAMMVMIMWMTNRH